MAFFCVLCCVLERASEGLYQGMDGYGCMYGSFTGLFDDSGGGGWMGMDVFASGNRRQNRIPLPIPIPIPIPNHKKNPGSNSLHVYMVV
ncbi:hypothetical protein DFH27DRAFT_579042 [Peziza echinospora]|nr:hypothetical protein DFH27DRAFT_579042 [Peziza echinospora]